METDLKKRVETLEINQAFLEQNIEQLEKTLFLQQKLLDDCCRQIAALIKRLEGQTGADKAQPVFDPNQEVPPHY